MNRVILSGRIANNLELKVTSTGKEVLNFSIAVRNGEGTDFFNCVAWEKTAEIIKNSLNKGDKVAIVGKVYNRSYEKDGEKRTTTEINVQEVEFFAPKKDLKLEENFREITPDEDLPF